MSETPPPANGSARKDSPGAKSSEFKVTLATQIIGALMITAATYLQSKGKDPGDLLTIGAYLLGITTLGYMGARSFVKR